MSLRHRVTGMGVVPGRGTARALAEPLVRGVLDLGLLLTAARTRRRLGQVVAAGHAAAVVSGVRPGRRAEAMPVGPFQGGRLGAVGVVVRRGTGLGIGLGRHRWVLLDHAPGDVSR